MVEIYGNHHAIPWTPCIFCRNIVQFAVCISSLEETALCRRKENIVGYIVRWVAKIATGTNRNVNVGALCVRRRRRVEEYQQAILIGYVVNGFQAGLIHFGIFPVATASL